MISSFDIENLEKLLKDFYIAVGIKISIFDDEFNSIVEYPHEASNFCQNIRKSEYGLSMCHKCDKQACIRAKKLGKPHIYTCHAGLIEAITPIQIGSGVVGYAILAQMIPEEDYETSCNNAIDIAYNIFNISKEDSKKALKSMNTISNEKINACVKVLDAFSSYMQIKNLALWKNEDISDSIDNFILNNIENDISSDTICEHFHCSRSYLYKLSIQRFNMGIAQYISYCRINKAKELLKEGKDISYVVSKVGFKDYSYFCKVFKKQCKLTPLQYKKKYY